MKLKFNCALCGNKVERFPSQAKYDLIFCSINCHNKHLAKVKKYVPKTAFKKGQIPHNKGVSCSEEQKQQIRNTLRDKYIGDKSPSWKGGKSELNNLIRTNSRYVEWRTHVFQRDSYICQLCNNKGGTLEVHHKISFKNIIDDNKIKTIEDALKCKFLWDITNGITLCKKCHSKIDSNRRIK